MALDDDDLDNNEELTPPPDSPLSHASSVPPANDEIVVGTNKPINNKESSPNGLSDPDDTEMLDDVASAQPSPDSTGQQKRKRNSIYSEAVEDTPTPATPALDEVDARYQRPVKPAKLHGVGGVKGVTLGYWRDSEPEDPKDKHAVIGFIDVRDRLRTRIQPTARDGRNIVHEYPLPPGPGGSWVTFEKVAFDDHLVNLDHFQVKEYVKIRAETVRKDETPEEKAKLNHAAVTEAIRRVEANPPPETTAPVAIAYGTNIPEHAQMPHRPDAKKRRLAGQYGGSPAGSPAPTKPQVLDTLPGTRPTRILLGYWKKSSEELVENKHAVFGILGANDMFRVKLTREARDGHTVVGNFPQGAGALWIHWEDVEFEPHLKQLSRPEVKEYCRVRQHQIDNGETRDERVANETKAVYEAQQRVANMSAYTVPVYSKREDAGSMPQPIAMKNAQINGSNGYDETMADNGQRIPYHDPQAQQRRAYANGPRMGGRHSLPDVELRDAHRPYGVDALERTNSIARREVQKVEQMQQKANERLHRSQFQQQQQAAAMLQQGQNPGHHGGAVGIPGASIGVGGPGTHKMMFNENVSRLNKVWQDQESNRIKAGAEDAKMYMGIKYERKQNGPFVGKLVSQGTIISIDGEDYVEYRVLTKPTFF